MTNLNGLASNFGDAARKLERIVNKNRTRDEKLAAVMALPNHALYGLSFRAVYKLYECLLENYAVHQALSADDRRVAEKLANYFSPPTANLHVMWIPSELRMGRIKLFIAQQLRGADVPPEQDELRQAAVQDYKTRLEKFIAGKEVKRPGIAKDSPIFYREIFVLTAPYASSLQGFCPKKLLLQRADSYTLSSLQGDRSLRKRLLALYGPEI